MERITVDDFQQPRANPEEPSLVELQALVKRLPRGPASSFNIPTMQLASPGRAFVAWKQIDLREPPIDFMTGRLLRYRLDAKNGFVLYSAGFDGRLGPGGMLRGGIGSGAAKLGDLRGHELCGS